MHRRWQIVILLFLCSLVNNLDRQTLSVLSPTMQHVLHFDPKEYSYVVSAFLAAYALGYVFCGSIIDRVGVKTTLACALCFWSVAGMLHAFATGWVMLAAFRFLLGLGESFVSPSGIKAIAEWVPAKERGLSAAVFSNGNTVGAILAPPVVSVLALHTSWRGGFIIPGLAGLVLLVFWLRYYDSPENDDRISGEERALIVGDSKALTISQKPVSFWHLLWNPLCIGFFLLRFFTDPVTYFFAFWIPDYLTRARAFSLGMIGLVAWIPFLASDIGGLGGGTLSDMLVRRGCQAQRARQIVMLGAALLMPICGSVVLVKSSILCIALLACAFAAQSCWMANQLALISESVERHSVARVLSISALGGSLGGMISTLIAGRVIAHYGYTPVFLCLGFLHLLGWLLLQGFGRRSQAKSRISHSQVAIH
jgi:ACS family hexuronate transporter-like MFS transporter